MDYLLRVYFSFLLNIKWTNSFVLQCPCFSCSKEICHSSLSPYNVVLGYQIPNETSLELGRCWIIVRGGSMILFRGVQGQKSLKKKGTLCYCAGHKVSPGGASLGIKGRKHKNRGTNFLRGGVCTPRIHF